MTRDTKQYLSDIAASIEKIQLFTEGLTFEGFAANYMAVDAVLFNFQVIGEAASHIPVETQALYPVVPWSKMKAM